MDRGWKRYGFVFCEKKLGFFIERNRKKLVGCM